MESDLFDTVWIDARIREGNTSEAIDRLTRCLDKMESSNEAVAPGFYERLAIIYHKKKDVDNEIAVLERFSHQKHGFGVMPPRLLERLRKLKEKHSR